MKQCGICDCVVRFPQHFVTYSLVKKEVVVCEAHRDQKLDEEQFLRKLQAKIRYEGAIASWDYLWQGMGRT